MDELLALMHDTMSPVATIKSAANLLKTDTNLSSEERTKLLDAIGERADRLNAVLDAFYKSQKQNQK